jgi:hypothetical protein
MPLYDEEGTGAYLYSSIHLLALRRMFLPFSLEMFSLEGGE